jgi:membrane protease YdiL (CAAX protease family)
LIIALLFSAIPLAALYWRVGRQWTAIFNGFWLGYVGWGLLFGVLNLLFTYVIGAIAVATMELAPNATVAGLASGGAPDGAGVFYLRTGIQLFGEEVITILPFLFLLWLGVKHLGMSRGGAVILAWIGSALLFAAIHLPTYDWHVGQALLLIGPVRLVLTLAYIKTKSIWTSTVAHVLNDWTMFTLALILGSQQTPP